MRFLRIALLLTLPFLFTYCGDEPEDEEGGGGGGESTIPEDPEPFQGLVAKLKASNLVSSSERATPTACTVTGDTGLTSGVCTSPFAVTGKVAAIAVGASGGTFRLLSGSELAVPLTTTGAIDHTAIDFSGTQLAGVGSNFSGVGEEWWNRVALYFTELDVRTRLNGVYWTVRYSFVPTAPLSDSAISDCIVNAAFINDINNQAASASIAMSRGDVLFCRRSDTTACAASEFRWLDTVNLSFSTSRPVDDDAKFEDPATRAFAVCSEDATAPRGYRVNLIGVRVVAAVSDPFRIVRKSDGTFEYATQSGLSATSADLRAVFSISLANLVQLADVSDISGMSDESIANSFTLSVLSSLFHNATDAGALLTAGIKFDTVSP